MLGCIYSRSPPCVDGCRAESSIARLYRSRSARQLRGPHVVHEIRVAAPVLFRTLPSRLLLGGRQRLRCLALGVGLLPRRCLRFAHRCSLPFQEVQQRQIEVIGMTTVAPMRCAFKDHHFAIPNARMGLQPETSNGKTATSPLRTPWIVTALLQRQRYINNSAWWLFWVVPRIDGA